MRLLLSLLLVISAQALLCLEVEAQSQTPSCPSLKISCPTEMVWNATPVKLSLDISSDIPLVNLKYKWQVSAGEIISGQDTSRISVDTTNLAGQTITVTVEVDGISTECAKTASCEFSVVERGLPPRATKFDEYYELSWTDEEVRLDNFAIELQQSPGKWKGYVTIYGPRNVDEHLARVRDYLVEKGGIDSDRIVLVNGGHSKKVRTELWVVPTGAQPPRPTPDF